VWARRKPWGKRAVWCSFISERRFAAYFLENYTGGDAFIFKSRLTLVLYRMRVLAEE
jgi:hypothetical protein